MVWSGLAHLSLARLPGAIFLRRPRPSGFSTGRAGAVGSIIIKYRVAKMGQIGRGWFCHTRIHEQSNDSRISRGRTPENCSHSATDGTRSRAHPAAAAWPPSHGETAQAGIATSGQDRKQKEEKEKDCCRSSQETTRLGKDGSENPQEGVTGLNRIQKIPQSRKIEENL